MKWCWSGWWCLPWLPITHTITSSPNQHGGFRDAAIQLMSRAVRQKKTKTFATLITCTDSKAFVAFVPLSWFSIWRSNQSPLAYLNTSTTRNIKRCQHAVSTHYAGILNASGCFVIHHLIKRTQIKSCETVRPGTLPIEEGWQSSTYPPNNLSKCALSLRACTPRLGNSHPRLSIWFIKVIWSAWPNRTAHPQI